MALNGRCRLGIFYTRDHEMGSSGTPRQDLNDYQHALISAGSVGQPRGGVPGAEFGIFDHIASGWHIIRLSYDLQPMLSTIRRLAFPEHLIGRLLRGC